METGTLEPNLDLSWWDDWDNARDGPKRKQELIVPQAFKWRCCGRAGKPVDDDVQDGCQRAIHEAVGR